MEMVKFNIRGHLSLSIVLGDDTVLFTQKVFAKFDKVTRHIGLIGKRNVAGKINLFASNIHCNDYAAVNNIPESNATHIAKLHEKIQKP
uniref:Uncharacterized protein n=1 Tax=Cucumis melo TaxID=3656 RepID=A0A9I9E2D5_CUCME